MLRLNEECEKTVVRMEYELNIAGRGGFMDSDPIVALCQWTKHFTSPHNDGNHPVGARIFHFKSGTDANSGALHCSPGTESVRIQVRSSCPLQIAFNSATNRTHLRYRFPGSYLLLLLYDTVDGKGLVPRP